MAGWTLIWSVIVERPGSRTAVVEVLTRTAATAREAAGARRESSRSGVGALSASPPRSGCARIGSVERW